MSLKNLANEIFQPSTHSKTAQAVHEVPLKHKKRRKVKLVNWFLVDNVTL